MHTYVEDGPPDPDSKQEWLMGTIDTLIGKHISALPPEELEKAILTRADPRIAWKDSGFKNDIGGIVRAAKVMGAFTSFFMNKSLFDMIKPYVTYENFKAYVKRYEFKYPEHIAVVKRLAPGSIVYLRESALTLLKDL